MKSTNSALTIALIGLLSGCGNPMSLEKDLRRHEDKNKELELRNDSLAEDKRKYSQYIKGMMVTDNYRWFIADFPILFEEAKALCKEFDFQLPTVTQRKEFETQVFEKNPDWKDVSFYGSSFTIERMHVEPEQDDLSPDIALCMSEREFSDF